MNNIVIRDGTRPSPAGPAGAARSPPPHRRPDYNSVRIRTHCSPKCSAGPSTVHPSLR